MDKNTSTTSIDASRERDRLYNNNQINNNVITQPEPTLSTSTTTNTNNDNTTNTTNTSNSMTDFNDNTNNTNITHLSQNEQIIAQQLLNAYLIDDGDKDITTMASILLQSLESLSPNNNNQQPFNFEPFMQLRSEQYTGIIDEHDQILFNHRIFQAALLTNSPIIIDSTMPYINIDFATLNDDRSFGFDEEAYDIPNSTHALLDAIVAATRNGHCESIIHLINNYNLSPTIQLSQRHIHWYSPINLLHLSTCRNSTKLVEYLLPLCFNSTTSQDLRLSICNIARHGHLHLIKKFHDEYKVDLLHNIGQDVFTAAIRSNNIELIDYLTEVVGFNPHASELRKAVEYHKWDVVQHLINKYNINIPNDFNPLQYILRDMDMTPNMFDYLITTFNIDMSAINQPISKTEPPLLFLFAQYSQNVNILKHLIHKYNADPYYLYNHDGNNISILSWVINRQEYQFARLPKFELVEYLCELGLDVNQQGPYGYTPIHSIVCFHGSEEIILSIFQLLLKYAATIDDPCDLITRASQNNHFSVVQYLIEMYQPHIIDKSKFIATNLLHYTLRSTDSSIEFISFILLLGIFDINGKDTQNKTPIQYAMSNTKDIEVIKLLIQNGATVTIEDWMSLFNPQLSSSFKCRTHVFFECLDYFKDMDTYLLNQQNLPPFNSLLEYSMEHPYNIPNNIKKYINYRILIYRYKVNINEQDMYITNTKNTILHNFASDKYLQLLRFSLLSTHHKPDIYALNAHGQTFLHEIVTVRSSLDDDQIFNNNEFEHLLDAIIDVINQ